MVDDGKLSDPSIISTLGLERTETPSKKPTSSSSPSKSASAMAKSVSTAVSKPVSAAKARAVSASRQVKASVKKSGSNMFSEVQELWETHGLGKFFNFLSEHPVGNSVAGVFTDLRENLATVESLVLIMVYAEFFALVLSQLSFAEKPLYTIHFPQWITHLMAWCHCSSSQFAIRLPVLAAFVNRHSFLYPAFYWFVYFVGMPSVVGWLINFEAVHSKAAHICPVNMLTFSLSRFLIFVLVLKTDFMTLLSGGLVETTHRSLSVLLDGEHLPVKLFLTTCLIGVVYAAHGRKKL